MPFKYSEIFSFVKSVLPGVFNKARDIDPPFSASFNILSITFKNLVLSKSFKSANLGAVPPACILTFPAISSLIFKSY